jgi:hypothetical protein
LEAIVAKREREKRERVFEDAGRRVAEHRSDDSQVYTTPEGMHRFKPKAPGAYKLEIIPFEVGERATKMKKTYAKPGRWYYERTFFVHYGIGPNNAAYICNSMTFENGRCPVCDERGRLARSPNEKDQNLADQLKPKQRQLWLIYNHAEPQKGVQLWDFSFHLFGKALDTKINNADDEDKIKYKRFAHPEEGMTLKLDATEESGGAGNKFLDFTVDQFRERKDALDPDLFDHGICLDDLIIETPYDKLKEIFLQLDKDDDDKPKKAGAKKPAVKDDDDDPPPRKKPAAKDDDDEPKKKDTADAFGKGDDINFEYKDKPYTGTIVKVDREKKQYWVQVEGKEKPNILDRDDDTITAAEPPDDDDPPPKKKPAAAKDDDDDDPKPKKKPVAADDDDDDPPPKKKPKPADDDDDDPPAKTKKAAKDDDWD